jgi:hypothetical protein
LWDDATIKPWPTAIMEQQSKKKKWKAEFIFKTISRLTSQDTLWVL